MFVVLAGTGAFLSIGRSRTIGALSASLLSRGLWLVLMELTVVRLAWFFNRDYQLILLQVIWVINISMIVLAGLVHLRPAAVTAVGVVMIAAHNLFDGIHARLGAPPALPLPVTGRDWMITPLREQHLSVICPLIPWIGVMAAGYGCGTLLRRPEAEQHRLLLRLGLGLTALFVVLRALNVYGDPSRWSVQGSPVYTLLAFVNTTKYPPSLLYLLMTLGPAIALLPRLERLHGPVARFFVVFGRVPFFYYGLPLFLIHALSVVADVLSGHPARQLLTVFVFSPRTYGFGLPVIYAVWAGVVLALYPLCRWFAGVKARRREKWVSYV